MQKIPVVIGGRCRRPSGMSQVSRWNVFPRAVYSFAIARAEGIEYLFSARLSVARKS